jgi:uncharacterized protein YndB with AHSA1/START domain
MGITLLIAVALALALLLAYAATRPSDFVVSRSLQIAAPPERLFTHINDLRAMNRWNPFVQQDPDLQGEYSGPDAGAGAAYSFKGRKAGAGRIAITGATAPSQVLMQLDMSAPMEGHNRIEFTLRPVGGHTEVTWAMSGCANFISKLVCLFVSMDRMVGSQFDKGLQQLKALAEKA